MASEDVIELGSSDEEAEPAPKKVNASKRRPNAMVQIPSGVTIKPAKTSSHINPIRKLINKGLTVTKVNTSNRLSSNNRNGKPPTLPTRLPQIHNIKSLNSGIKPVQGPNIPFKTTTVVNPMNMVKKVNSAALFPRMPNPTPYNIPVKVLGIGQNVRSFNCLPSSITVTKSLGGAVSAAAGIKVRGQMPGVGVKFTEVSPGAKRPAAQGLSNLKKKQKVTPKQMLTVDLDVEEVPTTSTASPQWYLRPEDNTVVDVAEKEKQTKEDKKPSMEEQNNSEPKKYVEITIEDSPIKPVLSKRTHEIGAELAITIDDSPVKAAAAKATTGTDSDNEKSDQSPTERQSKKKLEYPKEAKAQSVVDTTIEIELEPIDTATGNEDNDSPNNDDACKKSDDEVIISEETVKKNKIEVVKDDTIIEVFESPAKTVQTPSSTPKKVDSQIRKVKPIEITAPTSEEVSEFPPVYQEFIDLCFKIENSNDMKTIVEKKIKNYYKQVPKEYTESEEFVELVQSKIFAMRAGPEKLYLYIKDIVDELNLQRKIAKAKPTEKETRDIEAEKFQYGEESEFDFKRQRQIRKLEKTLKKLHRAIQKLEEQEVDFDDEEDSVYLLTESDDSSSSIKDVERQLERERSVLLKRYKERMVRVHAKFCQLTNTKMPSEPRIQIQPRPGQPAGPAKRLEKWVNKKVPIGKPLPFPDFHDVLRCVRDSNDEDKLGWNEADIMEEARDLFTRCGKKLQRRRQENEWRLAASRISLEVDPAENSDELKKKLDTNKQMAAKKETEVFNKYADKQSQLKLEAVEIGDKEAEESPVESEDEEPQEENSTLENKEKRKERLRRLIHEKSKKVECREKESKDAANIEKKSSASEDDNKSSKNNTKREEPEQMEIDLIPKELNNDIMEVDEVSQNINEENASFKEKVHSISGDSKVDSDVDELHLLQKLHSDEVNTSAVDSTDSDSPVDISDTLTSSDNKKPMNSDVISIENSSYSEAEAKDDAKDVFMNVDSQDSVTEKEIVKGTKRVEIIIPERMSVEIECSSDGIQLNKTNNQEYNESVESILLATTDEEVDDVEKDKSPKSNDECVNLKDDAISIGETVVEIAKKNKLLKITSKETSLPRSENIKSSEPNSKETPSKCVEAVTEEENDPLAEVEPNIEKEAFADNGEVIEEIHSIESVDSDNIQEATIDRRSTSLADNDDVIMVDKQMSDVMDNPSIESLETDHFQEAAKESEDIIMSDKQLSYEIKKPSVATLDSENSQDTLKQNEVVAMKDKQVSSNMDNPSIDILASDNSQEATKKSVDVIMADEQQLEIMENPSLETLESDNSREPVARGSDESADLKENDEQHSESAIRRISITSKEIVEIHELTDSNSPDQVQDTLKDAKKSSKEIPIHENSSLLEDLSSDVALNDNLTAIAAVIK